MKEEKKKCKFCKSHKKLQTRFIKENKEKEQEDLKREEEPSFGLPKLASKLDYLYYVGANKQ